MDILRDIVAEQLLSDLTIPAVRWRRPVLVVIFGLPCTGKTELARHLARNFPLVNLATDAVRLRFGLPSGPATHEVIYEAAASLLGQSIGIVWDGIHNGRCNRERVRCFATEHQAEAELIFTIASEAVMQQRLEMRLSDPQGTIADGKFVITREHFSQIEAYLEPPEPDESITTVDTSSGSLDDQLQHLTARFRFLVS